MPEALTREPAIKLPVKVVPGASRSGIAGWLGNRLKLRISAAPERGKANAAVETLIAKSLGLAESQVRIIAGKTSARKTVEIAGLPESVILQRLGRTGHE